MRLWKIGCSVPSVIYIVALTEVVLLSRRASWRAVLLVAPAGVTTNPNKSVGSKSTHPNCSILFKGESWCLVRRATTRVAPTICFCPLCSSSRVGATLVVARRFPGLFSTRFILLSSRNAGNLEAEHPAPCILMREQFINVNRAFETEWNRRWLCRNALNRRCL